VETRFDTSFGSFELERWPLQAESELRAWDNADEYLLSAVSELDVASGSVVVLNDAWGALGVALADRGPLWVSDSACARQAAVLNLERNGRSDSSLNLVGSFEELEPNVSLVVARLPRSRSMFEDQLRRLRPSLSEGAVVIAGAMSKDVHMSTLRMMGRVIGSTTTSLARRRARLITSVWESPSPGPWRWPQSFDGPDPEVRLCHHAGVFSEGGVDDGSALLLSCVRVLAEDARILDLGCGDGVLGLTLAARHRGAQVTFVDDSERAVESARCSAAATADSLDRFEFIQAGKLFPEAEAPAGPDADPEANPVADVSAGPEANPAGKSSTSGVVEPGSFDVVVINPPFHAGKARGDHTAWQMFHEARRALRRGGEVWVVGNRHLGYHARLKRLFSRVEVAASDQRFVVLRCTKR
jgi:16S rRNA (guanine1207-N2)-methyltransferase